MPSDDDLLHVVDRAAECDMAQGDLLADIICVLADQLNVDRQRLAEEINRLYAPVTSSEIYQSVYNASRARILGRVCEKP